jgi:hypothetical protein
MNITTIPIDKSVRDELKNLGKKGETYNTIIRRLIDSYNERSSS